MSRPIAFVDLDDTLFQTLRKCPPEEHAHLTLGATATNGMHSMMTRRQRAFVDWLLAGAETIPVTARSSEAYGRVAIRFGHEAIVANGAVVLDADGRPDPLWAEIMARDLAAHRGMLDDLIGRGRAVAQSVGLDTRSWIVTEDIGADEPLCAYAVFKQNDGDGRRLDELARALSSAFDLRAWTIHHNGNNFALLPPALSKRRAVEFLLERLRAGDPARPAIGLGDSLTDLPFMQACDFWGAPGESQLSQRLGRALAAESP